MSTVVTPVPTVYNGVWWGLEPLNSPGGGLDAPNKNRLINVTHAINPSITLQPAVGGAFDILAQLGREVTNLTYSGPLNATEVVPFYLSLFHDTTPVTVGTAGKSWLWQPDMWAIQQNRTLYIKRGSGALCGSCNYGLINEAVWTFDQNTAMINGTGFGRRWQTPISVPTAPYTFLEKTKFNALDVDFYVASQYSDLATATRIANGYRAVVRFADRYALSQPVRSDIPDYAAHQPQKPTCTLEFLLGAQYIPEWLGHMRATDELWVRIVAKGAQFEAGPPAVRYLHTLDFRGAIQSVGNPDNVNNQEVMQWNMASVADDSNPLRVEVVNKQAVIPAS